MHNDDTTIYNNDENRDISTLSFTELCFQNSSYFSDVSVRIFVASYPVALYVRIFVVRANKVEGTMS